MMNLFEVSKEIADRLIEVHGVVDRGHLLADGKQAAFAQVARSAAEEHLPAAVLERT